jgi:hypothetical protein
MNSIKTILAPLVAGLMLAQSTAWAAEEDTVQAAIPWDAEGEVYNVGPTTVAFLGSLRGIIYVENSRGEMHEGFVVCPVVQRIDLATGETDATGHCEITASADSVLYAKMTCKGEPGSCVGEFTLTAGEGKFAGVSGKGRLRVRSPIRALVADVASGSMLRVGSGLAIINDLKYSIP